MNMVLSRRVADAVVFMGLAFAAWAPVCGQGRADVEGVLRAVADRAVNDVSYQFVDPRDGGRYSTPEEAPRGSILRLASPVNDWRYWNGVLNIAMARVGEQLREPRYRLFVENNIAFAFDHYRFFEARRVRENKWEYPFGQLFLMEELPITDARRR